jgi:putative hydrolase of the HAD superfamily
VIEAVLFDIDGTLLDHEMASTQSLRAALEAERGALDAATHDEALAEWRRLEEAHYGTYLSGEIDLHEQRRRRAAGILEWLGAPSRPRPELDTWFERFLDGYRAQWSLFDDVEATIGALEAAGLPLGVITNADAAAQRRKLAALGIDSRLPTFVASSEVGRPKPEPEIFHEACAIVGLPPGRVAYVGDRLDIDARGARDAGLLGIWLDRLGDAASLNEDPGVVVVETLTALVEVLEGAGPGNSAPGSDAAG